MTETFELHRLDPEHPGGRFGVTARRPHPATPDRFRAFGTRGEALSWVGREARDRDFVLLADEGRHGRAGDFDFR